MNFWFKITACLLLLYSCTGKEFQGYSESGRKSTNLRDQNNQSLGSKDLQDTINHKLETKRVYHDGKLWKEENYKEGKLHGKNFEYWENGEVLMTEYQDGVRDGYYMHYAAENASAKYLIKWFKGQPVWSTFPIQIEEQFSPIKGFIYKKPDTIEIVIPYISGSILSRGSLIGQEQGSAIPIGQHEVFYESGELKAIVDYDTDSVLSYDLNSNLIEKGPISEFLWKKKN